MISRRELKMTAKMRLRQADPGYLKVMIVYILAAVVMPQVALTVVAPSAEAIQRMYDLISNGLDPEMVFQLLSVSPLQLVLQQALNVVLQLYQVIMAFGLTRYCLSLYRGEPCGPADLFSGFSMAGRVLGQQILVNLIVTACVLVVTVPVTLTAIFAMSLDGTLGGLLLLAVGAGAMVPVVAVMLSYVLAALALADRPELGAMGAIQYSKNLMRGHKGQYFFLELSFLGWSLLCSLPMSLFASFEAVQAMSLAANFPLLGSAGPILNLPAWADSLISLVLSLPVYLWLTPYMNTATVGFYETLQAQGFQPPDPGATAWDPNP